MIKKLDRYIITTFFGPFFLVFAILFFIFVVNIIWIQLGQFVGKGLTYLEILRLLYYMSLSVVPMVLPLTVLLASIMAFGGLGERYELAALKAAGISLARTMLPLALISVVLAAILFLLANTIITNFQKKAINMRLNITQVRPALNFSEGQFLDQIPGYTIKFDDINEENGRDVSGIFIHKQAYHYENQQTIRAKTGKFELSENPNFLRFTLFDGFIFEENAGGDFRQRLRQADRMIGFKKFVVYFDITELRKKALEKEQVSDDYRFKSYGQVEPAITKYLQESRTRFITLNQDILNQTNAYLPYIGKVKTDAQAKPHLDLHKTKKQQRLEILFNAYRRIGDLKVQNENKYSEQKPIVKLWTKMVIYQQRIVASSLSCILFFFIGASLGSVIRKGGLGVPVIIAIVIFTLFFVITQFSDNLSGNGVFNPYIAAWIPNIILFPLSIWFTVNALRDSQLFDTEKYKAVLKPVTSRIFKNKEHQRYR